MSNVSLQKIAMQVVQINKRQFDPRVFETMKTNCILDKFLSHANGFPKAINIMVTGDPGVGKTTVCLDIISELEQQSLESDEPIRALFISAEMNEIDLKLYVDRYPKFGDVQTWFPGEVDCSINPRAVVDELEELLNLGWDIILVDSFVELQDHIREALEIGAKQSENWILNLFEKHNAGNNARKVYTSTIFIQQVTKGGVFVGSNKLKHMTTAFLHIQFENPENDESDRYLQFSKNRRGDVLRKLYFSLHSTGRVEYDEDRYNRVQEMEEQIKKEKEFMKKSGNDFAATFLKKGVVQATAAEEVKDPE